MAAKKKINQSQSFHNPLFRVVIFILTFFILIGEATRFILRQSITLPGRVLLVTFRLFERMYRSFIRSIKNIKLPHIYFPKISFHIKLPSWKFHAVALKKTKKIRKRNIPKKLIGLKIRFFLFGLGCMFFIALVIGGYEFIQTLPNPKLIGTLNYPVSTQILDRKGRLIYEIFQDQNRTPIPLKELPPYVGQAAIAIEDKDFYKHYGISIFSGIIRAIKDMIITGNLQGGSTITQQLVKSALLSPERTVTRKIKEITLALWTERIFKKDKILELYLNQVPYGGSAYGIEQASQTYFGKSSEKLTLPEAAMLAGLPQAPTYYSPYTNPDITMSRRNEVLKKMYEQKYISFSAYKNAISTPLLIKPFNQYIKAPHFVFYVKALLEKEYGNFSVGQGGLRVKTSIDLDLQDEYERILQDELAKVEYLNISNGAILATVPSTGEILAMVGSRDYFATPSGSFNITADALRQPGSSIKPLMYSLALERGYTATTLVDDAPTSFSIPGSEVYKPVNYDGAYHGKVTLRSALANSYNIPAVKVLNTLGVNNFVEHAKKMGISTFNEPERYGLSITLGGAEVKMTDMSVAFGVFANQGKKIPLNPILSISDFRGNILYSADALKEGEQVISEDTAYIISNILSDNNARRPAFGFNSQLEIKNQKVAVKTGTTNDKKDNWTIGYTPKYLISVWVGNNDNTPMNPFLTSGITGAAPIWNRTMSFLLNQYSLRGSLNQATNEFISPTDIVKRNCAGKIEYYKRGTENKVNCLSIYPSESPSRFPSQFPSIIVSPTSIPPIKPSTIPLPIYQDIDQNKPY